MIKKLVRHGNSLALVIDKPVLDLLKINENTQLEIKTLDGESLEIKPIKVTENSRIDLKDALEEINKNFSKTLSKLAK